MKRGSASTSGASASSSKNVFVGPHRRWWTLEFTSATASSGKHNLATAQQLNVQPRGQCDRVLADKLAARRTRRPRPDHTPIQDGAPDQDRLRPTSGPPKSHLWIPWPKLSPLLIRRARVLRLAPPLGRQIPPLDSLAHSSFPYWTDELNSPHLWAA